MRIFLQVKERQELNIVLLVYEIVHGLAPAYLTPLFTVMSNVHSRNTQSHPIYLQYPIVGKGVLVRLIKVVGHRLCNALDPAL